VVDSLFVGETDNIGNPVTPEEKAYGRSLPKRSIPDFPIRAYEYYDYRHDVVNTTFVNFQDNKQRGSGALSWLLYTGAGVTTENTVKSAKYINAKPVYFPKIDSRFDSDNRSGSAYRTAAIHDLDGSTTGIPDSYVLLNDGENDSVATDDTCEIHPTWNASVCAGDIGRIQFSIRRPGPTSGVGLALKDVALRSAGPARGAGPGRAAGPARAAAPALPIILSRNGKDFKITANQSTVRAGTEIRVKTERPEVAISLSEMAKDSWVVFELPGFTNATSGKQQDSIDALRKATETSYFKGPDAVWVKLVIPTAPRGIGMDQFGPSDTQTSITVRR
jgi:cell migration-inducing and hyaluronan-binding protein